MKPTDHQWTRYCNTKIGEACSASASVLTAIEQGGHVWRYDMPLLDEAIANLQQARALHLARLAEQDKAA